MGERKKPHRREWQPNPHTAENGSETMRVPTYFSNDPNDPEIHHVHSDCLVGKRIPFPNRRSGTNGAPLCTECASHHYLRDWPKLWF
ncbi:hypothetical protein CIK75_10160 [Glutamicibacter sp. BW78]|nr:hypothetical protein CIK75_10160 [Glutamicibacter sp. BW78]